MKPIKFIRNFFHYILFIVRTFLMQSQDIFTNNEPGANVQMEYSMNPMGVSQFQVDPYA